MLERDLGPIDNEIPEHRRVCSFCGALTDDWDRECGHCGRTEPVPVCMECDRPLQEGEVLVCAECATHTGPEA